MHDTMTPLPDQSAALAHLDARLADADTQRALGGFTVLLLDIDHCNAGDDEMGRGASDELRQLVSQRAINILRDTDYIGGFGAHKLLVVVPQISDRETINLVANKLIGGLARPYAIGGKEVHIAVSIGGSFFAQHGRDRETLLDCANIALAAAKRAGRNGACIFEANLRGQTMTRP